ncbi:MAG: cytochrome b/b6 domain-containing protein [Pseudomonadota bacterium]
MALSNTRQSYGSLSKTLHWATALSILALIPLGIIANGLPFDTSEQLARKAFLFSIHKTLGVTVFFLALVRIGWMIAQPKPAPLHPDRGLETFAAELVHWALYGALVLVPLSGWIHHAATTGFAPIWWPFGQNLPLVPKSEGIAHLFAGLHIVFERVLVIALALHIAGALKHKFIDKDGTLARMLPRGGSVPPAPKRAESTVQHMLPPLGAAAAFVLAITVGNALGLYHGKGTAAVAQTELAEVASDWQVESGSLDITVSQLGAPVTGQFEQWTAEITYDPDTQTGATTVTIAIPSLTLGSVTGQALDTEFFDATTHPTAVFTAQIAPASEGSEAPLVATGTLTLKGAEMPLVLPFDLTLTDGLAEMTGSATVQRLDFGIGPSYPDEASVGFSVEITVALTARQQES